MIATPTKEQQRAIELMGHNLIVSASAGSGKTAVMIERAANLIVSGGAVDELLMVTFTNDAAAQMRARLSRELTARLDGASGEQAAHLRTQLSQVHHAHICTIDAFCQQLVRRFFHLADVDPLFRLASEPQKAVLTTRAVQALMDEEFMKGEQPFFHCLQSLCGREERALVRLILDIHTFACTTPDPFGWLAHAAAVYGDETALRAMMAEQWAQARDTLARLATTVEEMTTRLRAHAGQRGTAPPKMATSLAAVGEALRLCAEAPSLPAQGLASLRTLKLPAMDRRHSGGMEEAEFAPLRPLAQLVSSSLRTLLQQPLFTLGEGGVLRTMAAMAPAVNTLVDLVVRFDALFAAAKREANVLTFADVELLALALLDHDSVRTALHTQYRAVFVDEYQDTNALQEALLSRVAAAGALFLVGDVKQSIYAFRHTEPALFVARYLRSRDADTVGDALGQDVRLDLSTNFRSTQTLLRFVNDVMARTMSEDLGGLAYDDKQALVPSDFAPVGAPVRVMLSTQEVGDSGLSVHKRQALLCAQRVRELTAGVVQADGSVVRYRYEDIAILLRSKQAPMEAVVQTLLDCGIPVSSKLEDDVLSAQETGAMLQLLRAVDNMRDDEAMLCALRSPLASLRAADLAHIRAHDKSLPFALCVRVFAQSGSGPAHARVADFLRTLDELRAHSRTMRVDKLLSLVYERTQALPYYAALPGGAQKVDNLQALWLFAQTFAGEDDGSLHGFLKMLELYAQLGVNQIQSSPAGGAGAVRVMTVHASKGLEFPAVICPMLDATFREDKDAVVLTREEGIGVYVYDEATDSRQNGYLRERAKARKKSVGLAGELRLLYVALTRAQQDLTLIAHQPAQSLGKLLPAQGEAPHNASSTLGWLFPALIGHPEAGALRDCLLGQGDVTSEALITPRDYALSLSLFDTEAIAACDHRPAPPAPERPPEADEDVSYVDQRLTYRYPYGSQNLVPRKMSVTALNDRAVQHHQPLALPEDAAASPTALSGAQVGTAVHLAMVKLAFGQVDTLPQICQQLERMVGAGLLTAQECAAIEPSLLFAFFQTPLGQRLRRARTRLQEKPFVLQVPASLLDEQASGAFTSSLQGIIDCAFHEPEGWVLLDYKTNQLPRDGNINTLVQAYQTQIDVYRFALETLTKQPVQQAFLCFLRLDETIEMAKGPVYHALATQRLG